MEKDLKIWLVTTDHLEEGLWFREEQDFKVGMNYVAAVTADIPVSMLAFILMSNHVHFVQMGTRENTEAFINEFKRRYSKYLQYRYGSAKLLKQNHADIRQIPFESEAAGRAVAYVLMNCVAANICSHPTQYPWGSGAVYFNATSPKGVRVDSLSRRERFRLMHSKTGLPGHWLVGEEGYILPASYIKTDFVEHIFRKPSRMEFFLRSSSKARRRLESDSEAHASFKDQTLLLALPELCQALYGKSSFRELSEEQKTEVLRQLRFRFSSNVHQLARIVGLSYDAAARLLDSQ